MYGRVRGYQYSGADGKCLNHFSNGRSPSMEGPNIDGVSIAHDMNPRQHIRTFIASQDENYNDWRIVHKTIVSY